MPCHDSSHYKKQIVSQLANVNTNVNKTLKMNATTMTHPVRHICMPTKQTINGINMQLNILFNENQSNP